MRRKGMHKKLASILVAAAMVMTSMPTYAATPDASQEAVVVEEAAVPALEEGAGAEGNTTADGNDQTTETTLQSQINVEESEVTINLSKDTIESITIPKGKTVTLDLSGNTLTNVDGNDTITNNGTLIITGKGTVDNVSHGKAAVINNVGAKAILDGGTYTRSQETGKTPEESGGNSYYTLLNRGTMTIEEGVEVTQKGHFSSMIENGWYNGSQNTTKTASVLTINGGTFEGGLNTVKNDDYGELTITGGDFKNVSQAVILNWNVAEIQGGTFVSDMDVILNGYLNDTMDKGNLTITGGTFTAADGHEVIDQMGDSKRIGDIAVSGGTYNQAIPAEYCVNGFMPVETVPGTFEVKAGGVAQVGEQFYPTLERAVAQASNGAIVKLMANVADTPMLPIKGGKQLIVDLNGFNIGFAKEQNFEVQNGSLEISGKGKVYEQEPYYAPVLLKGSTDANASNYSVVKIDKDVLLEGWSGVFIRQSENAAYGVEAEINGTINSVKDGAGDAGHGVYINGSINSTEDNIPQISLGESSSITSFGTGIYAAGHADWTLKGDITAPNALSIKSGIFEISSGIYHSTGAFADPALGNSNGSEDTGAALSITSNDDYAEKTEVTVTGGTFVSDNSYAVYEGIAVKDGAPMANSSYATLSIKNGYFKGNTSKGAVSIDAMLNKDVISGGYFNTDIPSAYIAEDKVLALNTGENAHEYGYTVSDQSETVVKPSVGTPEVTLPESMTEEEKAAVEKAAEKIEASGLGAYANAEVDKIKEQEANELKSEGEAALETAGVNIDEEDTVTVYAQTFLNIEAKKFTKAENDQNQTTAVYSLDIVPMYRLVASIAESSDDIELGDNDKNAVVLENSEKELTNVNNIIITIPLPAGFITGDENVETLFVKHEKGSDVYYHEAEVSKISAARSESYSISFRNDKGFSTFTVLGAGTVAEVNGTGYTSLSAAIEAANASEVVLLSDVTEAVETSENANATLNLNGHTITGTLTNNGTLTIKGGKITDDITSNGTTYIESGEFNGTLVKGENGKFSITGGTFAEDQLKPEYIAPGHVIDGNTVRPATPSGGGGGTTTPFYTITAPAETEGGKVIASGNSANQGDTVTLTVEAKEGYELDELIVTDASGAKVELTQTADGKFTFQMPGSNVEIKATFKVEGQQKQEIKILKAQARDLADRTLNDKNTKVKFAKGKAPKTDVTYESSNDKVVAVDEEGHIRYTGLGEAVITVKAAETEEYKAAEVSVTVKVGLKQPTFTPSARDNGFTVTSSTVKGAEKFQVQYVLKGRSFKHDSAKSKTFTVDNKLRKGKVSAANKKTYRIRVRAINGDVKSKWSPVKTITTK